MKEYTSNFKSALVAAGIFIVINAAIAPALSEDKTAGAAGTATQECKVNCVQPYEAPEPHSPKPEAPDVISVLEELARAYSRGDLETYKKLLDPEITAIDDRTNRLMKGKEAVLASLKDAFALHAAGGPEPLLALTIDEPYVKVTGDMAVVTYKAIEQIGGSHPERREKLSTAVFVKDGENWLLVHNRVQSVNIAASQKAP